MVLAVSAMKHATSVPRDATPNLHPHIRELVPLPDYLPVIAVNQLNFMYTSGTIPATDAVYWHVWVYNCMSPEEQAAVMEAWEDEVMTTPASVYDEEVQIPLFTKVLPEEVWDNQPLMSLNDTFYRDTLPLPSDGGLWSSGSLDLTPPTPPSFPLRACARALCLPADLDVLTSVPHYNAAWSGYLPLDVAQVSPPPPSPDEVKPTISAWAVVKPVALYPAPAVVVQQRPAVVAWTPTYSEQPSIAYHYKFNDIPVAVRRKIKEHFEANHLSKDHFDSEICRRFMGLNEAAALVVIEGIPRRCKMVQTQIGSMQRILMAHLNRMIERCTKV